MDTKEYWDELADVYQVTDGTTDWLLGYPAVLRAIGDLNGKVVLDYGCGFGHFTRYMAQTYPLAHVIGVDTSPRSIKNARLKTDESLGVEFHLIDSHRDIERFAPDVVTMSFLLCTLPNIDTAVSIMSTVHAVLRPKGIFAVMEPHPESHGLHFTSFQSDPVEGKSSGDSLHVRLFTNSIDVEFEDYYWTKADCEQMFSRSGFPVVQTFEPVGHQFAHADLGAETERPPFIIYRALK